MSRRKQPGDKPGEAAKKARRQARLVVGPAPPSRVIEPKKKRKPRHKKSAEEPDWQ
jgi:hypothetical protein